MIDFYTFIDAFTEAQMGAREYACEMVRENCVEDDEDTCYANQGYDYCINEDEDEFDLQECIEGCQEFGDDGYYVGPYCASDATSIYLGFFTDQYCTTLATEGTFYSLYGYALPYSTETSTTIIGDGCAKCKEHGNENDQNEGDQEDEDKVLKQCEELYEGSMKCQDDVGGDVDNPDTSACGYITTMVSQEEAIVSSAARSGGTHLLTTDALLVLLCAIIVVGCCFQVWFCRYLNTKDKKKLDMDTPPAMAAKENLI